MAAFALSKTDECVFHADIKESGIWLLSYIVHIRKILTICNKLYWMHQYSIYHEGASQQIVMH